MVARLAKPGEAILGSMSTTKLLLLRATVELMISAGTVLDEIKRRTIYHKGCKPGEEDRLPKGLADTQMAVARLVDALRVFEGHAELRAEEILRIDAEDFFQRNDPVAMHQMHMAIGVAGEGCEMMEEMHRVLFQGLFERPEVMLEEHGDAEFYLEGSAASHGITRADALNANTQKLDTGADARYGKDGYSDEAALARKDKEKAGETYVDRIREQHEDPAEAEAPADDREG